MEGHRQRWEDRLDRLWAVGRWHVLTLSRPAPTGEEGSNPARIHLRPMVWRGELRVAIVYRYEKRDETSHCSPAEAVTRLREWMAGRYGEANWLTPEGDFVWRRWPDGRETWIERPPSRPEEPRWEGHDRNKRRLINAGAPWVAALGLGDGRGRILPRGQNKWRQVQKFLETIGALEREAPWSGPPSAVDMGSGKGYLTFALYQYLAGAGDSPVEVIGVERRPDLAEAGNRLARQCGYAGLHFESGEIQSVEIGKPGLLIALHACDTATDAALARGVRAGAVRLVVAPCCQHQWRREWQPPAAWEPILRHGLLAGRQAELLTDGFRALVLETFGYRTKVFEFVDSEHTAKNLLITAVRTGLEETAAREKLALAKAAFGVGETELERLLAGYGGPEGTVTG